VMPCLCSSLREEAEALPGTLPTYRMTVELYVDPYEHTKLTLAYTTGPCRSYQAGTFRWHMPAGGFDAEVGGSEKSTTAKCPGHHPCMLLQESKLEQERIKTLTMANLRADANV